VRKNLKKGLEMHDSALKNAKLFVEKYVSQSLPSILDVGSYDVNGSLKHIFPQGSLYIGLDMEHGNNVDCIIRDDYTFPLESNSFDIVVSSSCFEHCDFFWLVFLEMMRCLRPNGYMYINAPSAGHYHGYPNDYYRFYKDFGKMLIKLATLNGYLYSEGVLYRL
jgi:SAM-dependent methyltransferase